MADLDSLITEDGEYSTADFVTTTPEPAIPRIRKRKVMKEWKFVTTFTSESSALEMVEEEDTWAKKTKSNTIEGLKHYYRCNKVRKDQTCEAELYVLYRNDSLDVDIYKTCKDHCHPAPHPLTIGAKAKIKENMTNGMKPKAIQLKLEKAGIYLTIIQIRNYMTRCKRSMFGNSGMTAGDLLEWCYANSIEPADPDKMYALGHDIKLTDNNDGIQHLRVFITTKNLLRIMESTNLLHADGTYKLLWERLPAIVVGTTDMTRKFRPIGVAITFHETAEDYRFVFQTIANKLPNHNIR